MAGPTYLVPDYISYPMVQSYMGTIRVSNTPVDPTTGGGIYIEDINTQLAMAEAEVCSTILSNYLFIPLEGVNGEDFNTLATVPGVKELSYIPIRNLMISCALWYICKAYYATSGNANGQTLTQNALDKYNADKVAFEKLDNVTNSKLKNIFFGMKLAVNYSSRESAGGYIPDLPQGEDQIWQAVNSVPNMRWGFNK